MPAGVDDGSLSRGGAPTTCLAPSRDGAGRGSGRGEPVQRCRASAPAVTGTSAHGGVSAGGIASAWPSWPREERDDDHPDRGRLETQARRRAWMSRHPRMHRLGRRHLEAEYRRAGSGSRVRRQLASGSGELPKRFEGLLQEWGCPTSGGTSAGVRTSITGPDAARTRRSRTATGFVRRAPPAWRSHSWPTRSLGVEGPPGAAARPALLRRIGYELSPSSTRALECSSSASP